MASIKQTKHSNPLLTRRAALTTPPGALFSEMVVTVRKVRDRGQFWEGW
jgi:hypothetical protein